MSALARECGCGGSIAICKRACELGHSNSCADVALAISDQEQAQRYAKIGCEGGSGMGCNWLLDHGEKVESVPRVIRFLLVHCEQGHGDSCAGLAMHFDGHYGGKVMEAKASVYREQARVLRSQFMERDCRPGHWPLTK